MEIKNETKWRYFQNDFSCNTKMFYKIKMSEIQYLLDKSHLVEEETLVADAWKYLPDLFSLNDVIWIPKRLRQGFEVLLRPATFRKVFD